jgi:hypothetical protein
MNDLEEHKITMRNLFAKLPLCHCGTKPKFDFLSTEYELLFFVRCHTCMPKSNPNIIYSACHYTPIDAFNSWKRKNGH